MCSLRYTSSDTLAVTCFRRVLFSPPLIERPREFAPTRAAIIASASHAGPRSRHRGPRRDIPPSSCQARRMRARSAQASAYATDRGHSLKGADRLPLLSRRGSSGLVWASIQLRSVEEAIECVRQASACLQTVRTTPHSRLQPKTRQRGKCAIVQLLRKLVAIVGLDPASLGT